MIGSGQSNIRTVVSIAQAQRQDAKVPDVIEAFASLGSYGNHPQNEERDLHRWLRDHHNISLETYSAPMQLQVMPLLLILCVNTWQN